MKTISQEQRLQLIGLLTLTTHHTKALEDIQAAALEITGEKDEDGKPHAYGHTCDAIWDDSRRDADALLDRLNIKVLPAERY